MTIAQPVNELLPAERVSLLAIEGRIERLIVTIAHLSRDVGAHLKEIRDRRLYRAEYGTFEEYVEARWNVSRRRAYQLIDWAEVSKNIEAAECVPVVHKPTERQARELVELENAEQASAFAEAIEASGNKAPATKEVAAVVARRLASTSDSAAVVIPPPGNCPRGGSHDWTCEGSEAFCSKCKEPANSDATEVAARTDTDVKRIGIGVIKANEAIDSLKAIPKNDKLRARAWEIVRDWMGANE